MKKRRRGDDQDRGLEDLGCFYFRLFFQFSTILTWVKFGVCIGVLDMAIVDFLFRVAT